MARWMSNNGLRARRVDGLMASYPPMKLVSFFLEILPLAGFFLGYEFFGLFAAAVISVGLGALVMGANWLQTRRLARFALF